MVIQAWYNLPTNRLKYYCFKSIEKRKNELKKKKKNTDSSAWLISYIMTAKYSQRSHESCAAPEAEALCRGSWKDWKVNAETESRLLTQILNCARTGYFPFLFSQWSISFISSSLDQRSMLLTLCHQIAMVFYVFRPYLYVYMVIKIALLVK